MEAARPRLAAVDLARGVAIVAMVVYHTAFDLSANRLIATDVASDLRLEDLRASDRRDVSLSCRCQSGSGDAERASTARPSSAALAFVAGGAVLVSIATWWFDPATFVFFGILHEIAVASVLALPFLGLPSWLVAAGRSGGHCRAVVSRQSVLRRLAAFWWLGLSTEPPVTVDYVPFFPWFGVVLAGLVGGRLLVTHGGALWNWHPADALSEALTTAGRWSLAIYLVHQPLIVAARLRIHAIFVPPSEAVVREGFTAQCVAACSSEAGRTGECTALCGCMFENLYGTDLFAMKSIGADVARAGGALGRHRRPLPHAAASLGPLRTRCRHVAANRAGACR